MSQAVILTRRYALALVLTAAAYVVAAVIGLRWSAIPGIAVIVWPAAGVAFAALVIGGARLWPAVFAGWLIAAAIADVRLPWWSNGVVAVAAAVGAALPTYAIERLGGLDRNLSSMRAMLTLVLAGASGGALLAATIAALGGPPGVFTTDWLHWGSGYAVGTLIVAPLILTWWQRSAWRMSLPTLIHYALCMASVTAVAYATFYGSWLFPAWYIYPALVWAALAFQMRGASVALIIATLFALASAVAGEGILTAFADDPYERALFAQQFIAVSALTIFFLAAVADERRAIARLRESERRFRLMADSSPALIWVSDESGSLTFANRRFAELFDKPMESLHGDGWHSILHRADAADYVAAFRAAVEGQTYFSRDVRVIDGQGKERWLHCEALPRFTRGRFAGHHGVNLDVTSTKTAERLARDSEATSNLALSVGNMASWRWDMKTGLLTAGGSADVFGQEPGTSRPAAEVTGRIHPDDQARAEAVTMKAIETGQPYSIEYRYRKPDGRLEWLVTHARPLFDDSGNLTHLIGVSQVITDRKRADEHRQLLVNELNHRVKNTLAIVQGLAQQTFRDQRVPPELRTAFEGRLTALAAAHSVLTRENWDSAPIRQIVDDALRPFSATRFDIEGPDLRIGPKPAVSLALALHELATNAAKYGALSAGAGRVELHWLVDLQQRRGFTLCWREMGGPPVEMPAHRGFGSRLIERGLAAELDASVRIDYRQDGLRCELNAPLERLTA